MVVFYVPRLRLPLSRTEWFAIAGLLIALTALIGCILVGIAVPQRLQELALRRLGTVEQVVHGPVDPAKLAQPGRQILSAARATGSVAGVGAVTVYGLSAADLQARIGQVPASSSSSQPHSSQPPSSQPQSLAVAPAALPLGQPFSLRISKPSTHSGESLFGKKEGNEETRRFMAAATDAATFSENPTAAEPQAVYINKDFVGTATHHRISGTQVTPEQVRAATTPEALGYVLRTLPNGEQQIEHNSGYLRDDYVALYPGARRLLTYLANRMEVRGTLVPYSLVTGLDEAIPPGEIVLSKWTRQQLNAKAGDELLMEYYIWLPSGRLDTRTTKWKVSAQTREGDRQMSVEYPGISGSESMDDWDAPFAMNLKWIRPADELYWKQYRTTPKAFVSLADAQKLWGGRFGNVSSLRAKQLQFQLPKDLALDGVRIANVREQALAAAKGSTDFGGYFIAFSFFLIVAALLLAGLLLRLDVEQRATQIGLLRAVGFSQGTLLRWLALRAAFVWLAAAIAASLLAVALFYLLPERLLQAVSLSRNFLQPQNLLLAFPVALACALPGVIFGWLAYRHLNRLSIRQLLSGDWGKKPGQWFGRWNSLAGLAWSNCAQRPGRSWLTIGLIALAMLTLTSLQAFRHSGQPADPRFSHVAQSAVPIFRDLNSPEGRDEYGLPAVGRVHALRVRDGEDVSCLNAYAPARPRVVGISESLQTGEPWQLLKAAPADGITPALVDANSLQYVLHKAVGDVIDVGDGVQLRIVGTLQQSLFQSELLVGEGNFLKLFPREEGFRMWMVEGGPAGLEKEWNDRLSDFALQMEPSGVRLARYHAVENMYIDIFQVLGWLGLLVGVAGLGIILARNVVERRKQLALLNALGFSRAQVARIVVGEALALLLAGMAIGVGLGLAIAIPASVQRAQPLDWGNVAALVATVLATGLASCWLAARWMLRGQLLPALRSE